jgi:protein-disulfide isomerase
MTVLFFACVDNLKKQPMFKFLEVFKHPRSYIFCLSFFSVILSLFLLWVSSNVIHKLCILCCITYFFNFVLLGASKGEETTANHFINSFKDFFSALKNPGYTAVLVIFTVFASFSLFVINKSEVFIPITNNDFGVQMEKFKTNDYKVTGNILGDKNATVVLHEYTDFQCPYCAISNGMVHRLIAELDNVKVIHHNFPLDKTCNPIVKSQGHKNSCTVAKYSIAAKRQDKLWDFNSIVFENNENLDEAKIIKLASQVGINTAQLKNDADLSDTASELETEVEKADKLGLKSTPSYRIGMKVYQGLMPYQDLKNILISAGARPKK